MTLFLLASIGLTLIITKSRIFEPFRKWVEGDKPDSTLAYFIHCPQCVGFWTGTLFSPMLISMESNWFGHAVGGIACGCASSFVSLLAAHVTDLVFFHATMLNYQLNGRPQPPRPQPPTPSPMVEPTPKPVEKRVIPTVGNPHGYQPIPDPNMPDQPKPPRGSSAQSDLSGYRVDTADPNVVVNEKKWTHYDYEKEYNKRVAPVDTTEATE